MSAAQHNSKGMPGRFSQRVRHRVSRIPWQVICMRSGHIRKLSSYSNAILQPKGHCSSTKNASIACLLNLLHVYSPDVTPMSFSHQD